MTTRHLRSIETEYNGYRFRSRLEARWAVFFDALGIEWQYEPEGFELGDAGRYLPDFWLPQQRCWVEIKGQEPSHEEGNKAAALAAQSGSHVYVFFGQIPNPYPNDGADYSAYKHFGGGEGWDLNQQWCECPTCGYVGVQFEGRAARLPCPCAARRRERAYRECPRLRSTDPSALDTPCVIRGCACWDHWHDRGHNADSPRLVAAYTAARQARFEHGERGAARKRELKRGAGPVVAICRFCEARLPWGGALTEVWGMQFPCCEGCQPRLYRPTAGEPPGRCPSCGCSGEPLIRVEGAVNRCEHCHLPGRWIRPPDCVGRCWKCGAQPSEGLRMGTDLCIACALGPIDATELDG